MAIRVVRLGEPGIASAALTERMSAVAVVPYLPLDSREHPEW